MRKGPIKLQVTSPDSPERVERRRFTGQLGGQADRAEVIVVDIEPNYSSAARFANSSSLRTVIQLRAELTTPMPVAWSVRVAKKKGGWDFRYPLTA